MTETSTWSSLFGHPKVHSGQPDDRWMVTYPRGLLAVAAITNFFLNVSITWNRRRSRPRT